MFLSSSHKQFTFKWKSISNLLTHRMLAGEAWSWILIRVVSRLMVLVVSVLLCGLDKRRRRKSAGCCCYRSSTRLNTHWSFRSWWRKRKSSNRRPPGRPEQFRRASLGSTCVAISRSSGSWRPWMLSGFCRGVPTKRQLRRLSLDRKEHQLK